MRSKQQQEWWQGTKAAVLSCRWMSGERASGERPTRCHQLPLPQILDHPPMPYTSFHLSLLQLASLVAVVAGRKLSAKPGSLQPAVLAPQIFLLVYTSAYKLLEEVRGCERASRRQGRKPQPR